MNTDTNKVKIVLTKIENLIHECGGLKDLKYYLDRAMHFESALFKYAKFPIGSRVRLLRTPNFDSAWGWERCKHFLKRGAKGVIRDIDHNIEFCYDVEFNNETYIDMDGKKCPVTNKHVFHFLEKDLKKV